MAQGGGGAAAWPETLALTTELPAGMHYTTIMAREQNRNDGNVAPDELNASLDLLSWGGNACSFSGTPDAFSPDVLERGEVEPLFFAVDVSVVFGAGEEVRLDERDYSQWNAVYGPVGYGTGGGSNTQSYGVFESASIRSVAPGQKVQSVGGEHIITTQAGDIEVKVKVSNVNGGGGTIAHLMRPEQSKLATMVAVAASVRADIF